MYKKKASLFIASILLLGMVLTGCSTNTLGFITYMEEMQNVASSKVTETVSTLTVSDIKLPPNMLGHEDKTILASVNEYINHNYISITQKSDPKKVISSISADVFDKKTNTKANLFTLKYKDEAFAISTGPKLDDMVPGASAVLAPINNKLITNATLEKLLGDDAAALHVFSNPNMLAGLEKKSSSFLKDLMGIYKNVDTDLITKQDGAFVLQLDAKDLVKLIDSLVSLSLQNFDTILDTTIAFMNALTVEEFNALYSNMFPEGKTELVEMLKEAKAEFTEENMAQELLAMWNEIYPEVASPVLTTLNGSSLRMRTWKENGKYYTNLQSIIKVTDPHNPKAAFGTSILVKEETKVLSEGFNITMPTEEIRAETLEKILDNF